MKPVNLFREFIESEKSGGIVLMLCTLLSLVLANSVFQQQYVRFWNLSFAGESLTYWINEGLMTIFFLLIGLELEREIFKGELSGWRLASLPVIAATGGMLVPAALFLLFNAGTPEQRGAGIPMATDIAFALGTLSLLGKRVPVSLKIFLTALAVIDDLGAILVIAIFYSSGMAMINLLIVAGIFSGLLILNRFRVRFLPLYLAAGGLMWYFMLHSGIHPAITGVLLAFAIPFGDGGIKSPSFRLQHRLHKPVAFVILPLFALANTCLVLGPGWQQGLASNSSLGIFMGLVFGKPLGIILFSYLAVLTGCCKLPNDLNWKHVFGLGLLGGIGFTMSVFITLIAYTHAPLSMQAKTAILIASCFSGISGFLWLKRELVKDARH